MTDPDLAAWDEASGTGVLCIVEECPHREQMRGYRAEAARLRKVECSHREQMRDYSAEIAQLRKALDVVHAKLAEFAAIIGAHDEWGEYVAGPGNVLIPGHSASGGRLVESPARKRHGLGTSDVGVGEVEIAP